MSSCSVFFNSRVESNHLSFRCADIPKNLGNWCLTPIHYLFNGNEITITHCSQFPTEVKHEAIYKNDKVGQTFLQRVREYKSTFLNVVALIIFAIAFIPVQIYKAITWDPTFYKTVFAIAFLVPGLILGSVLKGLSYLSKSIRDEHSLAVMHFTPIERLNIGKHYARLNIAGITNELDGKNPLNQPVNALVIFAQPGTTIYTDPGIVRLNPRKLILVNACIKNLLTGNLDLDYKLSEELGWERRNYRGPNETYVIQHRVASLGAALLENPPKNRVYLV